MRVEVVTHHRHKKVSHKKVIEVIKKCSLHLLPLRSDISVAFLDDRKMASVNETYTGRKGATDVLSFPLGQDMHSRRWCGEILISLDRAYRQAGEKGISLIQEVIRLLVHALVHLGGFDHYDRDGFKKMRQTEFALLLKCL